MPHCAWRCMQQAPEGEANGARAAVLAALKSQGALQHDSRRQLAQQPENGDST